MEAHSPIPRTVEDVFNEFLGRRTGLIDALFFEEDEFFRECDPAKDNLCLYGHPNKTWEVTILVEDIPPDLPQPVLGINFGRDRMLRFYWLYMIAVHSDSWLISVAFYFAARFARNERRTEVDLRSPKRNYSQGKRLRIEEREPLFPSKDIGRNGYSVSKRSPLDLRLHLRRWCLCSTKLQDPETSKELMIISYLLLFSQFLKLFSQLFVIVFFRYFVNFFGV